MLVFMFLSYYFHRGRVAKVSGIAETARRRHVQQADRQVKQKPIALLNAGKRDVRTQFAALCFRVLRGKPEILLITSRRTGRWIIPKGWPMDGKTPTECAAIEAWEEAGVIGKAYPRCLGLFSYTKEMDEGEVDLPCAAMVYPVRVKSLARDYPEAGLRKRRWARPKRAAERVGEPELAQLLRNFDPASL